MGKKAGPLFLALCCAAVLFSGQGCIDRAAVLGSMEGAPDPSRASMIRGVPFFPQDKLMCGPASLASVLNYHGIEVGAEEVARAVYNASLRGTLTMDLLLYAKAKGLNAQYYSGGLPDLKEKVMEGTPLVVFLNLGFNLYPIGHYIVVTGFSDAYGVIIAHSGLEKDKVITYREFVNAWEKTDFSTLLVTPPPSGSE